MDTLTITFIGLIAFVLDPATDDVWALLVDASQGAPHPACDPEVFYKPVSHDATLIVPVAIAKEDTVGCKGEKKDYDGTEYLEIALKNFDVKIEAVSADEGLVLRGGRPADGDGELLPYPRMKNPSEAQDFSWLARVSSYAGSRGKVKKECLSSSFDVDTARECGLGARLRLDRGELGTECLKWRPASLCKGAKPEFVTHEFKGALNPLPSADPGFALAEGMELVLHELAEDVILNFTSFSGEECVVRIQNNTSDAEVFVVNQPRHGGQHNISDCNAVGYNSHNEMFSFFYKMTQLDERKVCPIPAEVCTGSGDPRCPLALLDPP